MGHIRKFESFRNNKVDRVNEEFILGAIKGALGSVMAAFGNTFKDFSNDFKKMFKEDDPNSIKSIIMTNFNQAVDGAQKKLGDKSVDEPSVNGLMDMITTDLAKLADGLDKDLVAALGKDKVSGPKDVAKAILIGNKEAKWAGIVGLLDPSKGKSGLQTNYKYSKVAYEAALTTAAKASPNDTLKARKDAANKFLDNMQKDIQSQLDKEFSEEEIQKVYDDAKKKAGQGGTEYVVGDNVIYLLKDKKKEDWDKLTDDQKKLPNDAPANTLVGVKVINKIEGDNITFLDKDNKPFTKTKDEIISKAEDTRSEDAKKAAESLGKIKNDPDKMKKVATFSDFLQDEKNKDKVAEIEKLMTPGA